jgi:hypothetical protein
VLVNSEIPSVVQEQCNAKSLFLRRLVKRVLVKAGVKTQNRKHGCGTEVEAELSVLTGLWVRLKHCKGHRPCHLEPLH